MSYSDDMMKNLAYRIQDLNNKISGLSQQLDIANTLKTIELSKDLGIISSVEAQKRLTQLLKTILPDAEDKNTHRKR